MPSATEICIHSRSSMGIVALTCVALVLCGCSRQGGSRPGPGEISGEYTCSLKEVTQKLEIIA